jgi:hypothetical protein
MKGPAVLSRRRFVTLISLASLMAAQRVLRRDLPVSEPSLFWKLTLPAGGETSEPGWGTIQPGDLPAAVTAAPTTTPVPVVPVVSTGFHDDFTQTKPGMLPDPAKWAIAENSQDPTGGSQIYTRDPAVVGVQAGAGVGGSNALVFQVQAYGGTPRQRTGASTITPVQCGYLSGRVTTFPEPAGNDTLWSWMRPSFEQFSFISGTFSVVAKLNPAAGFWPALWAYGVDQRWPTGGEFDLLENFGGSPPSGSKLDYAYFNIIGPRCIGDYDGADYEGTQTQMNASPASIADGNFHTYAMQINAACTEVSFTMDGVPYVNSPVTKAGWLAAMAAKGYPNAIWPAGSPLGIVMNVCVGGPNTVGGGLVPFPLASTVLPAEIMVVDSVSVTIP